MKKLGIIVFIAAIAIGIFFSSLFSFGRITGKIFNISFNSSVKGSGVPASENRDVAGFTAVEVGGIFQVEITAQKEYSLEVSTDDNLLQYIETEVSGGTLRIRTSERIKSHSPIVVRISAPDIDRIEASGASKVSVAGLNNSSLEVDTSGASKISLTGQTASLTVDVSGASNVDAENLASEKVTVDASGASKVSVAAGESLVADASGASKILYSGNPQNVEKRSSGASSVTAK